MSQFNSAARAILEVFHRDVRADQKFTVLAIFLEDGIGLSFHHWFESRPDRHGASSSPGEIHRLRISAVLDRDRVLSNNSKLRAGRHAEGNQAERFR